MNEKRWIKFRIVAWSVVAILLSIVLIINIWGCRGYIFTNNIFNKEFLVSTNKIVKTYNFDNVSDIKYIKTSLDSSDLIISENNEDSIKVVVKANRKLKNKKYINAKIESDTLNISDYDNKSNKNIVGMFNGYSMEVEVKVPKYYKKNITIDNSVGDISFHSDLNINNLDINIKTGDIEGSGRINAKEITINSKVGDMDFNYIDGENLFIKGKTGDIEIEKFSGKGSIESEIGDIDCDIENLTGDLALKSKIGDVSLYINRDISFIFEGNKSLGDIYTNLEFNNVSQSSEYFKGEFGKKSSNKITINVKTGNIEIND